jgi:hypothetical protein
VLSAFAVAFLHLGILHLHLHILKIRHTMIFTLQKRVNMASLSLLSYEGLLAMLALG